MAGLPSYSAPRKKSKESRARSARKKSIKDMLATWQTGYDASRGQFQGARQDILGRMESQQGAMTASLVGAGLSNTTAAAAGQRAVAMDTNRSLRDLATAQSQTEYSKWMDLAEIQSNTKWDGTVFQQQPKQSGWDKAMQVGSVGVSAYGASQI